MIADPTYQFSDPREFSSKRSLWLGFLFFNLLLMGAVTAFGDESDGEHAKRSLVDVQIAQTLHTIEMMVPKNAVMISPEAHRYLNSEYKRLKVLRPALEKSLTGQARQDFVHLLLFVDHYFMSEALTGPQQARLKQWERKKTTREKTLAPDEITRITWDTIADLRVALALDSLPDTDPKPNQRGAKAKEAFQQRDIPGGKPLQEFHQVQLTSVASELRHESDKLTLKKSFFRRAEKDPARLKKVLEDLDADHTRLERALKAATNETSQLYFYETNTLPVMEMGYLIVRKKDLRATKKIVLLRIESNDERRAPE